MTDRLVSLIMPVFETRPSWLQLAVSSALAQRGCRLELLVVDDGSVEPVSTLLAGLADPRLQIIRIDHAGPGAARNAGLERAQGDWLRFVDSDDVLDPDSTRHLASFMAGDGVIAYGATLVCDDALQPRRIIASTLQGRVARECLLGRFDTRLPALLFPRKAIERGGPWDATFAVSGDWDFVLRALDYAEVAGDQAVALRYRRHARSISGTARIATGEDTWRRLIAAYFLRHPDERRALERRAWGALYLDRGFAYLAAGDRRRAADRLLRAVLAEPAVAPTLARSLVRRLRRLVEPRRLMTRSTAESRES